MDRRGEVVPHAPVTVCRNCVHWHDYRVGRRGQGLCTAGRGINSNRLEDYPVTALMPLAGQLWGDPRFFVLREGEASRGSPT